MLLPLRIMKKKSPPQKKNLREYNRKLREINKALTLVRKQVREIHSQGPSFMNALEKRMEESMTRFQFIYSI